MNFGNRITVTKTFLPPKNDFLVYINHIWDTNIISNRGELVVSLEKKIMELLQVNHTLCVSNGTIGLQILLKTLEARDGEIITSPFSYVATSSSIVWEGFDPIFLRMIPGSFFYDVNEIKNLISDRTKALLLPHVYGIPYQLEVVENIAKQYNLPVFYDAAQCYGVRYNNESVFNFGTASICSLHATKILHAGEGGFISTKHAELFEKIFKLHNFGHNGFDIIDHLGINGKMSELNAAMALSVIPYISEIIENRRIRFEFYKTNLSKDIMTLQIPENIDWNYGYFPVILQNESSLIRVKDILNKHNIFPRRYFYPALNNLPYLERDKRFINVDISRNVLCLPLYHDLSFENIELISNIINQSI